MQTSKLQHYLATEQHEKAVVFGSLWAFIILFAYVTFGSIAFVLGVIALLSMTSWYVDATYNRRKPKRQRL